MSNYEMRTASADQHGSNKAAEEQKNKNIEANAENVRIVDERTGHIEQGKQVADQGISELTGLIEEAGEAAYNDGTGVHSEAVNRVVSESHDPAGETAEGVGQGGGADVERGQETGNRAEQFDQELENIEEAYEAGAGESAKEQGDVRVGIGEEQIEDSEQAKAGIEADRGRVDASSELNKG